MHIRYDDPHFYRFTSLSKNKLTTLINSFFCFWNDQEIFTCYSLLDRVVAKLN